MKADDKATYLGDGAYARFDGIMITVSADRSNGTHYVCLEYEVFRELVEFAKRLGWIKTEIDNEALDALQRKAGLRR